MEGEIPFCQIQTFTPFRASKANRDASCFESVPLVFARGALTDANGPFALPLDPGDDPALADTSAPAAQDLVGTLALASFTFADDGESRKIGYVGSKRYVRATITPA